MRQGRTLRQVSADARVSLGYISEVERGQKEASSELLAAICAALDVPLSEVLSEVSDAVALEEAALAMQLEAVQPVDLDSIELPQSDRRTGGDVVASAA
jgi:transcriptional regulator with XRE-family HTH domain